MKPWVITALPLLAGIAGPLKADPVGSLPPPPILTVFEKTMASAKTFSVVITTNHDGKTVDRATLTMVAPGKVRIDSLMGTEHEALISDGHQYKQWNDKQYYVGVAAPSLAELDAELGFDSLAGDFAEDAFLTPNQFAEIPEYTDLGQRDDNGETVDTLTASNFHGTKILTVDSATGLPIEYDYLRKQDGFTVKFSSYAIDKPVPPNEFTEPVPKNLVKYVVPKDADTLLAVGTPAPDFTLPTPDGQPVTLSSLKGKVVVVDFWASWCPPCKQSMPHVESIYTDLKDQGLTVLSVNTWDDPTFAKAFLAKHPWYNTTFLIDPSIDESVASTKYKVTGIPTLYVIDQTGNIAASFLGFDPGDEGKIRAELAKLGLKG